MQNSGVPARARATKSRGQLYGLLTHKTENVITFGAGDGNGDGDGGAFEIRFNIVNCVQNFVI